MGGRLWTEDDNKWLQWWWGTSVIPTIAKRLKRTEAAVARQAQTLGLTAVPSGWVRVAHLARESGFNPRFMLKLLIKAGIQIRSSWRLRGDVRFTYPIVDRERAEEAVQEWLSWETPEHAADRLGCSSGKLRTQLVRMGVPKPPYMTAWRLPPETYDAAYRAETVNVAAKRLGMKRRDLHKLVLAAGHKPPPAGRYWYLDPEVYNEVIQCA